MVSHLLALAVDLKPENGLNVKFQKPFLFWKVEVMHNIFM